MTPPESQTELRARFLAVMRTYKAERARLLAAGVDEWKLPRMDLRPFVALMCGARGKRTGLPCPLTCIHSNGRCKWHGGMSTGPKTPDGKARSARNGPGRQVPVGRQG